MFFYILWRGQKCNNKFEKTIGNKDKIKILF